MRKFAVYVLALLSIAWSVGAADAITFESKGFDDLATEAEQIFIGTASQAISRATDSGAIVTDYRFDDIENVKGSLATPVKITMLGGTVGTESMTVSGAPTFNLGTRYLVFVAGNGSVIFPVVGGHQGIFQIRTDAQTGASDVYDYGGRPVTELPTRTGVFSKQDFTSTIPARDSPVAPMPLSTEVFVRAIRSKLAR